MADNRVLYRKWRPQTFADFVGQEHVKKTVMNAIVAGKVAHAYLFAGPRGTGKTSMARLLAKAVNCTDSHAGEPCGKCDNCLALTQGRMLDVIEIDAASHTGVDDVRELIEKVNFSASVGKYKVYIIDEVHMLSKNAFNALLKTLEEPPAHAIFILATTEVHKLLPTIISRCQYFDFHHLKFSEIKDHIRRIAKAEKIDITDEAVQVIAENAEGGMRDAISILDQVAATGGQTIAKATLENLLGIVDNQVVRELTQHILDNQVAAGLTLINATYFKGYDMVQLSKRWLGYVRELLMLKLGSAELINRSEDEKQLMQAQADAFSVAEIINLLQRLVEAINKYKVGSTPQLALEMVMVKSVAGPGVVVASPPVQPSARTSPAVAEVAKPVESAEVVSATKPPAASVSADIWPRLCEAVKRVSPSLGALLKSGSARVAGEEMVIEAPSQFLVDTLARPHNHQLLTRELGNLGASQLAVRCVVANRTADVGSDVVAEVFDIM